jgi:predicted enzyme related to lactoylglutathione lyase
MCQVCLITYSCLVHLIAEGILNYIDVKSVDEYSARVKQLGGMVKVQKMAIPNMGYLAVCADTENNTFGLWQSDTSAK